MQLLEKYYMVKLDNFEDEGFNKRTLKLMMELEIFDCIGKEHLLEFSEEQRSLIKEKNKFNQKKAMEILYKMIKDRGECPKCHGFITSRFEEIKRKNIKERNRKIRANYNDKAKESFRENAAKMNAIWTPEKRAAAQQKRIETMAKKRAEKERLEALKNKVIDKNEKML